MRPTGFALGVAAGVLVCGAAACGGADVAPVVTSPADGPLVELLAPEAGARVEPGGTLSVRVRVDPRAGRVETVRLVLSGPLAQTHVLTPEPAAPGAPVEYAFELAVPTPLRVSPALSLRAFARVVDGAPVADGGLAVGGPGREGRSAARLLDVVDVTPPAVSVAAPRLRAARENGCAEPGGLEPFLVPVTAEDVGSGVAAVRLRVRAGGRELACLFDSGPTAPELDGGAAPRRERFARVFAVALAPEVRTGTLELVATAWSGGGAVPMSPCADSADGLPGALRARTEPVTFCVGAPDGDTLAPLVTLVEPALEGQGVPPGGVVSVRVKASDDASLVQRIELRARGPVDEASAAQTAWPEPAARAEASFEVRLRPDALGGASVELRAWAVDTALGAPNDGQDADPGSGAVAVRLLHVEDGAAPTVEILWPPPGAVVEAGETLTVRVRAADAGGLVSRVGLTLSGAGLGTPSAVFEDLTPPTAEAVREFPVLVPAAARPTAPLRVVAQALDAAVPPNAGFSSALSLLVRDLTPPVVAIVAPASPTSVDAGQRVTVSVTADDPSAGVALVRLRVSYGDSPLTPPAPQERVVDPPAQHVALDFDVLVPSELSRGALAVTAEAVDASANVARTAEATRLLVGDFDPPELVLFSVDPADAVALGADLRVRLGVRDLRSGLSAAELVAALAPAAGGAEQELARRDYTPTAEERAPGHVLADALDVSVPEDAHEGDLVRVALTAADSAAVPNVVTRVRAVPVVDRTPPRATLSVTPAPVNGQVSPGAVLSLVVVGDERFTGDSGLTSVGYTASGEFARLASWRASDSLPVDRAAGPEQRTFALPIPADACEGRVRLLPDVVDAAQVPNRQTAPALELVVVDSSSPAFELSEPRDGDLVRLGRSFHVRARASDAACGVEYIVIYVELYNAAGVFKRSEAPIDAEFVPEPGRERVLERDVTMPPGTAVGDQFKVRAEALDAGSAPTAVAGPAILHVVP